VLGWSEKDRERGRERRGEERRGRRNQRFFDRQKTWDIFGEESGSRGECRGEVGGWMAGWLDAHSLVDGWLLQKKWKGGRRESSVIRHSHTKKKES
jgi:hypothetical protein